METTTFTALKSSAGARPSQGPRLALRRAVDVLRGWRRRRDSRLALAAFDERMLRDIGITRAEVLVEINKPFWRK